MNIDSLSYRELQKECKARDLSAAGTTEDLQDRLRASLDDDAQGDDDAGKDAVVASEPEESVDWSAELEHDESESSYQCPECGAWKSRPWINPGDRCVECGGPPGNRA